MSVYHNVKKEIVIGVVVAVITSILTFVGGASSGLFQKLVDKEQAKETAEQLLADSDLSDALFSKMAEDRRFVIKATSNFRLTATEVFQNKEGKDLGENLKSSFQTQGGDALLFVSGSATAHKPDKTLYTMDILVDGKSVGELKVYSEGGHHEAFPSQLIVLDSLKSGEHYLELRPLSSKTNLNAADFFNATVVEWRSVKP